MPSDDVQKLDDECPLGGSEVDSSETTCGDAASNNQELISWLPLVAANDFLE